MAPRVMGWLLALVAAACTAPVSTEQEPPADRDSGSVEPAPAVEPAPEDAIASPHPEFPSGWRVFVVEPLELHVAPARFLSAPPSRVLMTGDRLSRWPIYGAIATPPE